MKKKFLALLLAGTTVVMMVTGCGNKTEEAGTTPAPTAEAVVTEEPVATTAPEPTKGLTSEAKVTLGQYKGMKLNEVDSEVIDEELKQMMLAYAEISVVDRAAATGDIVNINYVGKKDGVAFENGTDDSEEGFDLELGSGIFIPGFEEGLIGAVAGETRDIKLTFPEEYHSEELAGKEAVFTVTVNEVKESIVPELDDEFAKNNLGCDSAEAYISALREMRNKDSFVEQIWNTLLTTCTIEKYPEELLEQEKQAQIAYYTSMAETYASWYGMDAETVITDMMGFSSMEMFHTICEELARENITKDLILEEIATAENLSLTEAQYQESALQYALASGYEDLAMFEADYGRDEIFKVMTQAHIMEYLVSQADIVKAESGNAQ